MNNTPPPTALFSNSQEQLFSSLKERIKNCPQDPFYSIEIIVSDLHVKTVLQLELAKEKGILFGVQVTSILELAQRESGVSFLDMVIAASSTGVNFDMATSIATDLAQEVWYGCQHPRDSNIESKHNQAIALLCCPTKQPPPNETHVFAVSALCPKLNDILLLRPNVYYYVLSPCMHFWGDICSDQEAKKLTRRLHTKHAEALQGYLDDRSRLLANNGTRAREFISYLDEKLDSFHEEYVVKEWVAQDPIYSQYIRDDVVAKVISSAPTLLDVLQNDLLLMGAGRDVQRTFTKADTTIQVHKAPTYKREIEALYLYIQEIMPKVAGRIVVYAPDIELYKPYIQSLFTQNIEIVSAKEHVLLPHFLQILDMPYKRLHPKKTFELFQLEAFRNKCGIEFEDLELLAEVLQRFDVGHEAFKHQVIQSWISTYQRSIEFSSSDAEVLGKCLATLDDLFNDCKILEAKKTRPCLEWQKLFLQILDKYFEAYGEEFYSIKESLITVCQNRMLDHLGMIDQEKAVNVFKVALSQIEEQKASLCIAPIIFATLGAARTLAKDVVCLLGMQEGSFPRSSSNNLRKFGFLHAAKPPYTVSAIDRHLIIEAILTTSSMLYISYQSYGFKERSFLQPSGIVLDVLETLDNCCVIDGEIPSKVLIKDHPLESCVEGLFVREPVAEATMLHTAKDQPVEVLYTHELSQVAKYPMKAYMQHGLGLYLREYKAKVRSSEFEVIEPRALGMVKKQAFVLSQEHSKALVNQEYRFLPAALKSAACSLLEEDIELLNKNAKALGIKADEPLQIELSLTCKAIEQVDARSWKVPALILDIDGKQVTLAGDLVNVYSQGLVVFEKKSNDALFRVWPEMLLVNYLASVIPIEPSVLFVRDAKIESMRFDDSYSRLQEYVAYALDCRKSPSCIYPDWIEILQAEDLPPAKLTEISTFALRDPYLELYLTRVLPQDFQAEWSRWRAQALQLFKKTPLTKPNINAT